eukprot:scaffold198445_cov27-Tisochrysis_lutea.AAC.3
MLVAPCDGAASATAAPSAPLRMSLASRIAWRSAAPREAAEKVGEDKLRSLWQTRGGLSLSSSY